VLFAAIGAVGFTYAVLMAHARIFLPAHLLGRGMTAVNFLFISGAASAPVRLGLVHRDAARFRLRRGRDLRQSALGLCGAAAGGCRGLCIYTGAGGEAERSRTGVLSDFFIGAHAAVAELPLLTRDPKRYRAYFPSVVLITP
jgi:hypothetical protein